MATTDLLKIKEGFDRYIVKPANAFGLGGFVFDVEGEATVNRQADITDHYTETNIAIQDNIAIRPKRVTVRNYVGELVYREDKRSNTDLQKAVQKLTVLSSYLPDLSRAAQQAKGFFEGGLSQASLNSLLAENLVDLADLWGVVKNLTPPITRQQQAYMYFTALHEQKILLSIETPFEYMTNMAIESIVAYQGEDSKYISDFAITLKEMRFAQTQYTAFDQNKYQSRTKSQISAVQSGGKVNGQSVTLDSSPVAPPSALPPSLSVGNLPVINVTPLNQKAITNDDIKALSNDPIFKANYPKIPIKPPKI